MTQPGHFFWCELNTWNPEKAKEFYRRSVGWEFERIDNQDGEGDYWLCKADDVPVAGILTYTSPQHDGAEDVWIPYVAVDDVDKRVEIALDAGAKIRRETWDLPNVGRLAILTAPDGAIVALIQLKD